jgi:hypothetical protein
MPGKWIFNFILGVSVCYFERQVNRKILGPSEIVTDSQLRLALGYHFVIYLAVPRKIMMNFKQNDC